MSTGKVSYSAMEPAVTTAYCLEMEHRAVWVNLPRHARYAEVAGSIASTVRVKTSSSDY